jgi:RTX calcium-binding nonapeptide repeat (4 copies)
LPDPPDPNTESRTIVLESGTPNPSGGSGNDSFTGIVEGTVRAGGGDDRFDFENGYGARVFGGTGNDSFEGGFGDNFILNGGSGDDVFGFTADTFDGAGANGGTGNDSFTVALPDVQNSAGAVLSGGDGVDTFNLSFTSGIASDAGAGQQAVLKDFRPGVDVLDIDVEGYSRAELIENAEGGFTDLRLHFSALNTDGAAVERYATVRLEGIMGTTLADLGVTLPEPPESQGRLYEIAPGGLGLVNGGSGNDTISGIADGRFFGGDGDDLFAIEDGFGATLDGGAGNDVMNIDEVAALTILGGVGNDVINVSSTSNIQEESTVDGGDGDDRLNVEVAITDPARIDAIRGGAGSDVFTLDLNVVSYGPSFRSDTMLVIDDFAATEDDLVVNIRPEDAPFYTGAQLIENDQDGSTDLVLSFEKSAADTGLLTQWTGVVKLMGVTGLVLADDGPIQVSAVA